MVAVAGIVFDEAGRVLLVERGRPPGVGLWTVPGGRLELGEAIADAVAREVREETGLVVTCGPLVEIVERVTVTEAGTYHYVILDHRATLVGGAATPVAGDDVTAARWVAADELASLPLTDGLIPVLERARAIRVVNAPSTR